jgi:hypothetical protein
MLEARRLVKRFHGHATTQGTIILFGISGAVLAVVCGIDMWQRRDRVDVELDELVELPTLRLGPIGPEGMSGMSFSELPAGYSRSSR